MNVVSLLQVGLNSLMFYVTLNPKEVKTSIDPPWFLMRTSLQDCDSTSGDVVAP